MERSQDWLNQAEGDPLHAKSNICRGGTMTGHASSAQQAAEQAVTAVFQRMSAETSGGTPWPTCSRNLQSGTRPLETAPADGPWARLAAILASTRLCALGLGEAPRVLGRAAGAWGIASDQPAWW